MNFAGKMNRAFAVYRIPASWIGRTVKLRVKTDFTYCVFDGMTDESPRRLPCRATGSTPNDLHFYDLPVLDFYLEFRSTKKLTVASKTNLSWKTTSGRRRKQSFAGYFFPGNDNRDIIFHTKGGQIGGQISVSQEIQDKVAGNFMGEILIGIVNYRRQYFIDIKHIEIEKIPAILPQTIYFRLTTAILLKDNDMLPL
ncbi:MAG: hypothetical protein VR65_26255 [Desulfobulbaceae bacterium BRH_c16a]|nr:MAG: hypothetical protein VR65_26255 [Desulfobulbaceae bacterium BRH_c16a]